MLKKLVACAALAAGLGLAFTLVTPPGGSVAQAADKQCKADGDCDKGQFCILAENPPVCRPPQAAGAKCVRDVVCSSGKCDMSKGKPGVCQ